VVRPNPGFEPTGLIGSTSPGTFCAGGSSPGRSACQLE